FGPNQLVNNSLNQNADRDLFVIISSQYSKLANLKNYKTNNNPQLKFKIILSVLLPTDTSNLTQFFARETVL
ncbi:22252_t:CDS:2, partial [Racocetra persica]